MNERKRTLKVWLVFERSINILKYLSVLIGFIFLGSSFSLHAQVVSDNNKTYQTGSNTTSVTISSFTVPSGNYRILVVNSSQEGLFSNISGITYNGQSLTKVDDLGGFYIVELWYLLLGNGPEVTSDIVVTFASTATEAVVGACSFNGVEQSGPFGNTTNTGGTPGLGHSSSLSVNTESGDAVVDALILILNGTTATLTDGASQEEVYNMGFTSIKGGGSYELATGTTTEMSWSWIAGNFSALNYIALAGQLKKSSVLPVELSYFRGEETDDYVFLEWETQSESNNKGFEIQRSVDGIEFEMVGWLDGAGTTFEIKKYHFEDENVKAGNTYYYRLAQLDWDETVVYSNIITINFRGEVLSDFQTNPNPVTLSESAFLTFESAEAGIGKLSIYDAFGRTLRQSDIAIVAGKMTLDLGLENFENGLYYVKLEFGESRKVQKLMIAD